MIEFTIVFVYGCMMWYLIAKEYEGKKK